MNGARGRRSETTRLVEAVSEPALDASAIARLGLNLAADVRAEVLGRAERSQWPPVELGGSWWHHAGGEPSWRAWGQGAIAQDFTLARQALERVAS